LTGPLLIGPKRGLGLKKKKKGSIKSGAAFRDRCLKAAGPVKPLNNPPARGGRSRGPGEEALKTTG